MSSAQSVSPAGRLIIVEPGHFHASLLQREMYPNLSERVSVYAPLGPELADYLNRIWLFNTRKENPAHWQLDVHTSDDPMAAMLAARPGNIVIFSGRNRGKIGRILASLEAGLHVLADKPWIIESSDMDTLGRALALAEQRGLAAYDIMTERYEVTSQLQRELVHSPEVFGKLDTGSESDPAIRARSVHHVMKVVAGLPLRRPAWFFDTVEYGEGLSDVGTHVVDLMQWTAFPDQAIDYRKDIHMLGAEHWPLELSLEQFRQVTGEAEFPPALANNIVSGKFQYYCNNTVRYQLRGVHVKLDILWNWQAAEGGDVYEATFRGSRARVEIRQGKPENYRPEVYVVAHRPEQAKEIMEALRRKVKDLQSRWPGLSMKENGTEARMDIPDQFRVGHEAHFAQVAARFFEYRGAPQSMPAWERPNMLAKYYVSTRGVELARKNK